MTQTVTQPVAVQADYQRIPGNKAVATVQGAQPSGNGTGPAGEATWGYIIGSIDNQADLIARLDAKVDLVTYQAVVPPHIANTNNPHQVTKAQVGLDQVDNTADINKPISNPTKVYVDGQVATLDNTKVAKAGDTMTGPLAVTFADTNTAGVSINTPNATLIMNKGVGVTQALVDGRRNNLMRWRVALGDATAESGLNAGSDYALNRYDDAGALIGTVYKVIRGSGQLQVIQNTATPALRVQALSTGNATIDLQKGAASSGNSIRGGMGSMTTGLRWAMHLGDGTAESGSNTGSNFSLSNFSDAGSILWSIFQIRRSTGAVSFGPGANFGQVGNVNSAYMNLNKAGTGTTSVLFGTNNGVARWSVELGSTDAESGGNNGSRFAVNAYDDAGTYNGTAFRIERATRHVFFSNRINSTEGYTIQAGSGAGPGASVYNFNWTGSLQAWVDATNVGTVTLTSDERVKQAIVDMPDHHAAFMAIVPKQYRWGDVGIFRDDGREYSGWSAQQLLACGFGHAVDGDITAVQENGDPQPASVQDRPILAQAVLEIQALHALVAELRAEINAMKGTA